MNICKKKGANMHFLQYFFGFLNKNVYFCSRFGES